MEKAHYIFPRCDHWCLTGVLDEFRVTRLLRYKRPQVSMFLHYGGSICVRAVVLIPRSFTDQLCLHNKPWRRHSFISKTVSTCKANMPHFYCCAPGCKSSSLKKKQVKKYPFLVNVTFHRFPTEKSNPILRLQWIYAMKRDSDWEPNRYSRVCSLHFHGGRPTMQNLKLPSMFSYNNYTHPYIISNDLDIGTELEVGMDDQEVSQAPWLVDETGTLHNFCCWYFYMYHDL